MTMIRTQARVGPDGNVTVPVGMQESGRMVEVTVVPAATSTLDTINGLPAAEWWAIFNRTEGSIDDPTFVRPPQQPYEPRRAFD